MSSATLSQAWARHRHALIPALVAIALCIPGLTQGAFATDTAWYTAIGFGAWQRLLAGDFGGFWTLQGVADQPYFNKPPLGFWLNGLPLALLGPTIFAARLGSVAACVICVMASARLGRLLAGQGVGLSAGLVVALTWELVRHSHSFSLDLWMAAFLILAVCTTVSAHESSRPTRLMVGGFWIGLALLVKPIVPLLACLPLGIWLCTVGRARWLGWLGVAAFISVIVVAPWHYSMWCLHGQSFTQQYFGREILDRAAAGPAADFNKGSGSVLYYGDVLVRIYWPWLVTLALAIIAYARGEAQGRAKRAIALSIIWSFSWLVLLSLFPDKRPRYLLTLYPLAGVASAVFLDGLAPERVRGWWRVFSRWILPGASIVALTLTLAPVPLHRSAPPQWPALFAWVHENGNPSMLAGGFAPQRSAQYFLGTGHWPIPTRAVTGDLVVEPQRGAHLLYHRRDGFAPGTNERVEFSQGDLTVTSLLEPPWSPLRVPDPGE